MNFQKIRGAMVVAALFVASVAAHAQTGWTIDPVHSSASFTISHLGVSNVRGTFQKVTGTIDVDDANITKSSVDATIDIKSLSTGNTTRDGHVTGPNFFDADKFPAMTFKSTKVEKAGSGLKIYGNLTIKGVTKPVTLDVTEMSNAMPHPMMKGKMVRGFAASTQINRKDFGLAWSGPMAGADAAVGNDIKIDLNIEADK